MLMIDQIQELFFNHTMPISWCLLIVPFMEYASSFIGITISYGTSQFIPKKIEKDEAGNGYALVIGYSTYTWVVLATVFVEWGVVGLGGIQT